MKTAFLIILFLHGIIHILGFVKSYHLAEVPQLSFEIPKSLGNLWLFCFILFLAVFILMIFNKPWWPFFAIAAVMLSQTLIVIYWQDAKFGTILNIIILLVSIPALGKFQFDKMVQKEEKELLSNIPEKNDGKINKDDLAHLPEIVQKWIENSGVVGKQKIVSVRLKQKGEMKTKPDGTWMQFTAEQYFNVENPAFIWVTEVTALPGIHLSGRDKFKDVEGEMLIKLLSLIPVVDEGKNEKMNSGTMLRFLGETCWFPSAALNQYITWKEVDSTSAKAIFRLNNKEVTGLFTFTKNGEFQSFEAERYYGGGKDAQKEKWLVEALSYKEFEGIKVPYKSKVTWKLPGGDFNWLNLEITELEYNPQQIFN
ncbi:MAG TPA: DUF6544 family protein [Gillisia sp.]|nr:DUF6544 family protein [Gillisia sp.]